MLRNILFDLDGTLSDSQEGVIKCFQYAIMELRESYCCEFEIKKLIGIPIRLIFQKLLKSTDDELINKAISLYRERFSEIGIIMNKIYPGITELLDALHENSYGLYVVTLKNKDDAERIAKHFSFDKLLKGIYGPSLNGYPENKTQLIKTVLTDFKLVPDETVMIGDRKDDVSAGKSNRTMTIGVTYGYGSEDEITDSSPDYICHAPLEILSVIETAGK